MDLKFFLTFLSSVAYLKGVFEEEFFGLDSVVEVEPGCEFVACDRRWEVGGLTLEDQVFFNLSGSCFVYGEVGHPADYSLLIAYGYYDDPDDHPDNPKIGAYWVGDLPVWKTGDLFAAELNLPARLN